MVPSETNYEVSFPVAIPRRLTCTVYDTRSSVPVVKEADTRNDPSGQTLDRLWRLYLLQNLRLLRMYVFYH